jgi:hypothetical protein
MSRQIGKTNQKIALLHFLLSLNLKLLASRILFFSDENTFKAGKLKLCQFPMYSLAAVVFQAPVNG